MSNRAPMTTDQRDAVLLKLEQEFNFNTKRASGKYFRKGTCPQCHSNTLCTKPHLAALATDDGAQYPTFRAFIDLKEKPRHTTNTVVAFFI